MSNTILTIYINFGRPDLAARDCRNLCAVGAKPGETLDQTKSDDVYVDI